jgi:predicted Zn-dependent protease
MKARAIVSLLLYCWLGGCAVNPVTGDRELILVSGEQELAMGAQNYAPMQQSQGGVYDVDPALTAYVRSIGERLAASSDAKLPYEFVVLNNSVPNAWALPGGKIAINRGLLTELQSEAELSAVLSHEIVHAAARHTAQQMSRGMLMQGLVVATSVATNDSSYGNLAVGGANVAAQLTMMKYGRSAELESDKYGMRYMSKAGYDPQGAIALQETFVRLSEDRDEDWLSGLFASHPPSKERVQANKKTAEKLPVGGTIGVDSFKRAMSKTLAAKPAYDAYDEGREALAEKNTDAALAHANEALALNSGEAHFHALRGDVRLLNDQFDMAVTNYNRAINRRGDFFYYFVQRGLAKRKLGQVDAAIVDLERSIDLLPTAPAHYTLGTIKEERGLLQEAIDHYKVVAKSGGEYGKTAREAMVRLELPLLPASYISSACSADVSGQIIVQVRNDTPLVVAGVQAQFQYLNTAGEQRQSRHAFSDELAPGKISTARTGLSAYPTSRCEVVVVGAQIVE